ncbi:MAG: hypothetical protein R3B57_04570 [Phycisphaerales bacterium]
MKGACELVLVTLLGLCAPAASAQDGSLFQKQWQEAKAVEGLPDGIYLELEHNSAGVQTAPGYESPDGVYHSVIKLWWKSRDTWRYCKDSPGLPIAYNDAAWSTESEAAWMMGPTALTVVEPGHIPDRKDPSGLIANLPPLWQEWATGLEANSPLMFEPAAPATVGGDKRWSAEAISADGKRFISYRGIVSPAGDRLLVERAVAKDAENRVLGGLELSGWRREPLSPTGWIATAFESTGPNGEFVQSFAIKSLRPLRPEDQLDRLVAVPASDGEDLVRGVPTFRSVFDHRPERRSLTVDGVVQDLPRPAPHASAGLMRILGWLALAGLVLVLVYLRLRMK